LEKIPLIPVNPQRSIVLWYEGPTFLVADKPAGLETFPEEILQHDTLVNALLQSNRWLAEMETSLRPGVIHTLRRQDRGVTVVAKTDETAESLRQSHQDGAWRFRYRVQVPETLVPHPTPSVTVVDSRSYGTVTVYDIDATLGDTAQLAADWLGDPEAPATFYAYEVEVPTPYRRLTAGFGHRIVLPEIDLYTAPT
jgi:23S rRNA-/tRNA-specific pseudouridylate synthase